MTQPKHMIKSLIHYGRGPWKQIIEGLMWYWTKWLIIQVYGLALLEGLKFNHVPNSPLVNLIRQYKNVDPPWHYPLRLDSILNHQISDIRPRWTEPYMSTSSPSPCTDSDPIWIEGCWPGSLVTPCSNKNHILYKPKPITVNSLQSHTNNSTSNVSSLTSPLSRQQIMPPVIHPFQLSLSCYVGSTKPQVAYGTMK